MNQKDLKAQVKAEKDDAEPMETDLEKDEKKGKNSPQKPVSKVIAPFFTNQKQLKVQSAGAGQKGADYAPDKTNYHPINDAFWEYGEKWV